MNNYTDPGYGNSPYGSKEKVLISIVSSKFKCSKKIEIYSIYAYTPDKGKKRNF